jgi:hypothetical protein
MPEASKRPLRARKPVKKASAVKKVNGRPLALTDEMSSRLISAVRLGNSLRVAVSFAGSNEETLRLWRRRAEKALTLPAGRRSEGERKLIKFFGELDLAMDEALVRAQGTIHALMTRPLSTGDELLDAQRERITLDAAKFYLSHKNARDYNTQQRHELTGPDGQPIDVNIDADAAWALIAPMLEAHGMDVVDDEDDG